VTVVTVCSRAASGTNQVIRSDVTWNNAKKAVRLSAHADMLGVPETSLKVLEFGAFSSPMFEKGEVDV